MSENASGPDRSDVDREELGVALAEAIRELAYAVRLLAKHAPRDPDTLLTAEQVGELFGLSPRTLKDRAAAGALPHRRFGKHYRFSRGDVAEIVRITGCAQQSRGGRAA
ncbi:helix-turn-helix domain-containing protein [Amycolatopsis sp. NPDC058986]|uniref:helix-turn-helix domain-containing protein n=1 Tax=unclassified Amycolatopsis TaxID=2618356 RepID=UPI00366D05F3